MTNDGTDAPAAHHPTPPGWGERLALWAFAFILSMVLDVLLRLTLPTLIGHDSGRAVARGLSLGVFFFVVYGPYTLRSFSGYASLSVAAWAFADWLLG